jgi:hypothetical protein
MSVDDRVGREEGVRSGGSVSDRHTLDTERIARARSLMGLNGHVINLPVSADEST